MYLQFSLADTCTYLPDFFRVHSYAPLNKFLWIRKVYVYSDHFIQHLHNQTMLNASDFRRFKMKGLDLWRKLLMESNCKYKQSLWCYGQHILNVLNLGNVCVQCFYKSINIYLGAHRKTIVFALINPMDFFCVHQLWNATRQVNSMVD